MSLSVNVRWTSSNHPKKDPQEVCHFPRSTGSTFQPHKCRTEAEQSPKCSGIACLSSSFFLIGWSKTQPRRNHFQFTGFRLELDFVQFCFYISESNFLHFFWVLIFTQLRTYFL
uniref:Uncharacterized protein n=1 Tax=Opuntia streptacantha TaxID=393608 RepID=A0A7C9DVC5_OPUST